MNSVLADLTPSLVWKHFGCLASIPRGSGNEAQVLTYIRSQAVQLGLSWRQDPTGNMVIRKPATGGLAAAPTVALQAHVDMVCEKNGGLDFDFTHDPIELRRDGDYLTAAGTTLGADNGLGVAAMLALMEDPEAVHGPLELLFTVDEESGLSGASSLGGDMLSTDWTEEVPRAPGMAQERPARMLVNLDTEEDNAIYIGCAGGGKSEILLPVATTTPTADHQAVRLFLTGLHGGHSGVDIHLERGNAIKLLARLLFETNRHCPLLIASLNGGDKHNAIPREAEAVVLMPPGTPDWQQRLHSAFAALTREYRSKEPSLNLVVTPLPLSTNRTAEVSRAPGMNPERPIDRPATVMIKGTSDRLLHLLLALPSGVHRFSPDLPGLVETSCNLARVRTSGQEATIILSSRSPVRSQLDAMRDTIAAVAALAGAACSEDQPYPGWQPNPQSQLLAIFAGAAREIFGHEPAVRAIHAGLETGIIGEKYPGLDMISIGPRIEFPHCPGERVFIPSVAPFYRHLLKGLATVAAP